MPFGFKKTKKDEGQSTPIDREKFRALLDEDEDGEFEFGSLSSSDEDESGGLSEEKSSAPEQPREPEKKEASGFSFVPPVVKKDPPALLASEDKVVNEEKESGGGFSFVPPKNEPLEKLPQESIEEKMETEKSETPISTKETQVESESSNEQDQDKEDIKAKIAALEAELNYVKTKLQHAHNSIEEEKVLSQNNSENEREKAVTEKEDEQAWSIEKDEPNEKDEEIIKKSVEKSSAQAKSMESLGPSLLAQEDEEGGAPVNKEVKAEQEVEEIVNAPTEEELINEELEVSHKKKFMSRVEKQKVNDLEKAKKQAKFKALIQDLKKTEKELKREVDKNKLIRNNKKSDEKLSKSIIKISDSFETIKDRVGEMAETKEIITRIRERRKKEAAEKEARKESVVEPEIKVFEVSRQILNKPISREKVFGLWKRIKGKIIKPKPQVDPLKGFHMKATELSGDELEKEEVLDLKKQIARKKRLAVDAREAPSFREEKTDLRTKKDRPAKERQEKPKA